MKRMISGNETPDDLRQLLGGRAETDITLNRPALSQFVVRYLNGELTELQLQEIGDLLEMSVEYDAGNEEVIAQVLFEISSPEVNGEIDQERASEWKTMLTVTSSDQ
jgi:hypothetical protein